MYYIIIYTYIYIYIYDIHILYMYLVGGIPTPLKNMSLLGWLFPIYGKIKHVPNHQPGILYIYMI